MDIKHTDLLHKESVRLLNLQCALLSELISTKGLLHDNFQGKKSSLDIERACNDLEVLKGELQKLQHLDLVLAVVGTMKSGKSTTNNAIVGLEVLPNRNGPMTALPTLIRHTMGKTVPELLFEKNEPINNLVYKLRNKLDSPEGEELLQRAGHREDLERVADYILKGYKVSSRYVNEEGIFEFLKGLNDLVRLSSALEVEFPFEDFRSVDELPVIEVEFQHLCGEEQVYGRLSLLDTPGPNEEGQFALKHMMKEQLLRASGVIAVLDYTQLKSEADAEVRKELIEIAGVSKGRLTVLVNRFDQQDSNSDNEETIKKKVAYDLFQGYVSEEDIYPVSSKHAYLSGRAKKELEFFGKVSDFKGNSWVRDLLRQFGLHAEDEDYHEEIFDLLSDNETLEKKVERLWKKSRFEVPLENVIRRAHAQAAMLAIDSAASKLVDSAIRINNFLGLRETALKKSEEDLKKNIESLKDQVQRVADLEKKIKVNMESFESDLKKRFIEASEETTKSLMDAIEKYFKKGSFSCFEKDKEIFRQKECNNSEINCMDGFMQKLRKKLNKKIKGNSVDRDFRDFDPDLTKIEFETEEEARELLNRIFEATRSEYNRIQEVMRWAINYVQTDLKKESDKIERQAVDILNDLSYRMGKEGFDLKLNLPKHRSISIDLSEQKVLDDMLSKESREERKWRRSSGVWGSLCSWFNTDDWGWESYTRDVEYYKVDLDKIRKRTLADTKKIFDNSSQSIETNIVRPFEASCDDFLEALKTTIDEIRGDLLQGLEDGNHSKQEQEDLAKQLAALKLENSDSAGDIEELKQGSELALKDTEMEECFLPSVEAEEA